MDLLIRNIAKVGRADITADSITVIAGYNGSGKTAVSKALYAMLLCSSSEASDKARIESSFSTLYGSQLITHGSAEGSRITLRNSSGEFSLAFSRDGLSLQSYYPIGRDMSTLYLRAPSRWSSLSPDALDSALLRPLLSERTPLITAADELLGKFSSGSIEERNGSLYYADDDYPGFLVDLPNASSGAVIMAVFRRLIENGTIHEGSMLIIDEPETNLHPEKQVMLARLFASLSSDYGIRFLISSHNIYFIRALEVALSEHSEERHRFYLMSQDDGSPLYHSEDATESMEKIYHELYSPLEDL